MLAAFLTLTLAVLTAGLVLAAEPTLWSPAVNLSNLPGASSQATLSHDPLSGDLFVAWADSGVAPQTEILGRRWDRATQSWLPSTNLQAENLSQSEWADGGPEIFFDSQGHGLLLWTRRYAVSKGAPADSTDLMWRAWQGTSWSPEAVLLHADTYLPGTFTLIPVETPNSIFLFIVFDRGYRTTEYQNGQWSEVSPWAYLDVSLAKIVRDASGLMHAAAYGENSSQLGWDPYFHDAYYLTYDGNAWSQPLNLSYTDGVADAVSLAFDAQGHLHFLWSDANSIYSSESTLSAIWERVRGDTGWQPNTQVTTDEPQQAINGFSLATDVSGTLHLAWSEGLWVNGVHTDLDIYYRPGDGTAWGPEQKVYTSTQESRYPSLVAGKDEVALVWHEGPSAEREVYFSRQIAAAPCVGLNDVSLDGPVVATVNTPSTFVATSSPLTGTWPLTYTWQASGQPTLVHSGGFVDMVDFTWSVSGTKAVTVTVENCGGTVSDTHTITIQEQVFASTYLPIIIRNFSP